MDRILAFLPNYAFARLTNDKIEPFHEPALFNDIHVVHDLLRRQQAPFGPSTVLKDLAAQLSIVIRELSKITDDLTDDVPLIFGFGHAWKTPETKLQCN